MINKKRLQKAEFRVVVFYAGDADIALHAVKSADRLGKVGDLSLMVAVPEAEAIMIYPDSLPLEMRVGTEERIMKVPVGGVVTLNHPDESQKKEDKDDGND